MPNDRGRGRGRVYAPPPPPTRRSQHSALGYWVPLVVTATLGLGAIAAWVWNERNENEEGDRPGGKPQRPPTGQGQPYPPPGGQPYPSQGGQPYPGPPPPGGAGPQYPGGMPASAAAHTQPNMPPPVGAQSANVPPPPGGEAASYYGGSRSVDEGGWYGQVRGYMKRTPSPQQMLDSASRQVTAGMAAAGAALGSILEEDKGETNEPRMQGGKGRQSRRSRSREDEERVTGTRVEKEGFSDHERWSEEAEEKSRVGPATAAAVDAESERKADSARRNRGGNGKKGRSGRTIAVVVNSDLAMDSYAGDVETFTTEHASILSHLPTAYDPSKADLFVLIYAPHLKSFDPSRRQSSTAAPASTVGSSYSEINTPAVTPGSELQSISPRIAPDDSREGANKAFDSLYQQALALVSNPSQILPFTTPAGYVHILRHLAPQMVYLTDSEALSGRDGDNVAQLKGWVGHTILVVGDDGHGGLADTETEDEGGHGEGRDRRRWYEHSSMIGFGKEVEVVDATRVGDDWAKRVGGKE